MEPEELTEWVPIVRDVVIVLLAAFLLIYGVIAIQEPTVLGIVLGAALTLLGAPAAIRVDALRRKTARREDEENERWSHLP